MKCNKDHCACEEDNFNSCISCNEGSEKIRRIIDGDIYCTEKCEYGTFYIEEELLCESNPVLECLECHSSCFECSGPTYKECLTCFSEIEFNLRSN
jgi:hypothetical protein